MLRCPDVKFIGRFATNRAQDQTGGKTSTMKMMSGRLHEHQLFARLCCHHKYMNGFIKHVTIMPGHDEPLAEAAAHALSEGVGA